MEKKINIAELLKDCPQGMELDCTMYDNCTYEGIEDVGYIDILINTPSGRIRLTKEGCYIRHDDYAKCVIFPKGKTTWEGFVPPCKFKDGDVVTTETTVYTWISIYHEYRDDSCRTYADINVDLDLFYHSENALASSRNIVSQRLATEEEKARLFQRIKGEGYKWNAETKTMEKLVEPKFKAGSMIIRKKGVRERIQILDVDLKERGYLTSIKGCIIRFEDQDSFELVSDKFDITTLKPFDRVLVRDFNSQEWLISFFSHCSGLEIHKYAVINGDGYAQCIPYKGNEHLLGKKEDCADYFKTWK